MSETKQDLELVNKEKIIFHQVDITVHVDDRLKRKESKTINKNLDQVYSWKDGGPENGTWCPWKGPKGLKKILTNIEARENQRCLMVN